MSVRRKKLSVCERMLPPFRAVLKFCSTNRLFNGLLYSFINLAEFVRLMYSSYYRFLFILLAMVRGALRENGL